MTRERACLSGCPRVTSALVVGLLTAGCMDGGQTVVRTVVDSAGLEVISLEGIPSSSDESYSWRLELVRSIPTGSADPSQPPVLYDPRSLTRLLDGTIVVADAGERPLAIIPTDRDTVSLAFSRTGQGPGEIYGGYPLVWPGEAGTFWVADRGNARVSRFDTTGSVLDERPVVSGSGGTSLSWLVHEGSGRLYAQHFTRPVSGGPGQHSLAATDPATGELEVLLPFEQGVDPPGRMVLWNYRALWTVLPDGQLVTGHDDRGVFRIWGPRGDLVREVRLDLRPRPVTEADRLRVREELGAGPGSIDFTESFPFTDIYYPFADSLFALRHTWISHAEGDVVPEDVFVWRIVSSTGHYAGTITFPTGFEAKWTDGRLLLGVLRDALGVATIQEYRLVPPPTLEGSR